MCLFGLALFSEIFIIFVKDSPTKMNILKFFYSLTPPSPLLYLSTAAKTTLGTKINVKRADAISFF